MLYTRIQYESNLCCEATQVKGNMAKTAGFVISESIGSAWNLFKEKWYLIYGLYLVPVGIAIVYAMASGALGEDFGLMQMFLMFLYLVTQVVVSMGVIKGYLNLVRGKEISVETFTDMLPQAINYVLGTLLMGLIVIGGFILLIVPGIYFMIKYYFVPFLLVDKKLSPMEALKMSAKMTDGIKWEMVGFFYTSIILAYLGVFALILGVFVSAPVAGMSYVYLYEKALERVGEK